MNPINLEAAHAERLEREADWYRTEYQKFHPLNRWPLRSDLRNHLAHEIARFNLAASAHKLVPHREHVLLAPLGCGSDAAAFQRVWPDASMSGIDISPEAVERSQMKNVEVGDILNMPFESGIFDAAVSTLFFHHVADEGFDPYVLELGRVLCSGGVLVTMEPSFWHPLFAITRPLRRLVGNITGQVEHEHPIRASELKASMQRCGFGRVEVFPVSFGHNRMPTPITCTINVLRYVPALTHLAWQVGIVAWKD